MDNCKSLDAAHSVAAEFDFRACNLRYGNDARVEAHGVVADAQNVGI